MNDELYEELEKLFAAWEHRIARGELADGRPHHLMAIQDASQACGWRFFEREYTGVSDTQARYFRGTWAPVTLASYQSSEAPSPLDCGCAWDEFADGWDFCRYAHKQGDWEGYICLGAGYSNALDEAIDKGMIEERDFPESDDEALSVLKRAGFIPFDLGEFAKPIDVIDQVAQALRVLRAAAAKAEALKAQAPPKTISPSMFATVVSVTSANPESKTMRAAKRVMVDGMSANVAAKAEGINTGAVYQAVKRLQSVLDSGCCPYCGCELRE